MKDTITVREAAEGGEAARFWEQLRAYQARDLFPEPEDEDRAYFLGDEYRREIEEKHKRPQDRIRYLVFSRDGADIGLAMAVIYESEDGKCFLMEFCVFPEYRGWGTGTACAEAFLQWAGDNGAAYVELNYGSDPRRLRFWQRLGFVKNGADEWGDPMLMLPPEKECPFTVEVLADPEDWQLTKLENGFLAEIGEEPMTPEKRARLSAAIRQGKIVFFLAKRGYRAVGMCSVSRCFSTFTCADTGVFDDFYIEPVFRGKGIARLLTRAVFDWSETGSLGSVSVCCAPCDERMYQALGFDTAPGRTFVKLN